MNNRKYLLDLQALRRFKEEAIEKHRQVEEELFAYRVANREYHRLAKPKALMCEGLEVNDSRVERSWEQLYPITGAESMVNRPTKRDIRIMEECKQQLQMCHKSLFQMGRQRFIFTDSFGTPLVFAGNGSDMAALAAIELLPHPQP